MCGLLRIRLIYVSPTCDSLRVISVNSFISYLSAIIFCAAIPLDVLVVSFYSSSFADFPFGVYVGIPICFIVVSTV